MATDYRNNSRTYTTYVLGAGFSKSGGLPDQEGLSDLLLREPSGPTDTAIIKIIEALLRRVFGWRSERPVPSFEDIFNCVDLSVENGCCLGIEYPPVKLRALQHMIMYRVFTILDNVEIHPCDIDVFLDSIRNELHSIGFIVLNWDILLERRLEARGIHVDYCFPCYDWNESHGQISGNAKIYKLHGSSNWVYCDNCKSVFVDPLQKISLRTRAGLSKSDFELFRNDLDNQIPDIPEESDKCPFCGNTITQHSTTFSFRKLFKTHAYPAIWYGAEKLLSNSDRWVFIGYSLRDADYEFKHLLKTAQLNQMRPCSDQKRIEVVVCHDDMALERYEGFLGSNAIQTYRNGLSEYVQQRARVRG